jgi:RNA polymerase I-specific transcription initiation factor RRN5
MDDPDRPRTPTPQGDAHEQNEQSREPSPVALRLRLRPDLEEKDDAWDEASDSPPNSDDDDGPDSGEKSPARGSPAHASPLKRPAGDEVLSRPFKRQRGMLNMDYLDLLNQEIEDAAQRVCLYADDNLPSSHLGLTSWSGLEKRLFFEAVARVGRDNLEDIATRIGSKSVVEIKQYLALLEQEKQVRSLSDSRTVLEMASYPAAVELSQSCCRALEETADTISVKQERREQQREEKKWGEVWDLTPELASRLEKGDTQLLEGINLPSAAFFDVPQWLRLSQEIFMNSSIPNENCAYLDETPPSIWATTLEDFYSVVVSFTRRLVQTTIFMSMSRIRDAQNYRAGAMRNVIRKKDVRAAAKSLNLPPDSNEFWAKSARRLRLNVYDDSAGQTETASLTYDEVESLLEATNSDDDEEKEKEEGDEEEEAELDDDESDSQSDEESLINHEADEVLRHSAADFPETYKMRQALKHRVAMEQQQERFADQCDDYASYQAELEMWELLQKEPPTELPKMPEPPQSAGRSSMNVESIFKIGGSWRAYTGPWSEWELKHRSVRDS